MSPTRTKYNRNRVFGGIQSDRHNSNIEKYLQKEISYLLNPAGENFTQAEFNQIYVHNDDAEDLLTPYLTHTPSNNTFILTGLTGSGKSMLIRYVFGIHSIKPRISKDGKSIIIPFNFNNISSKNIESQFQSMMHSACAYLLEEFPNIREAKDSEEEFFEFIKERRSDLVYSPDQYPTPSKRDMLKSACKKEPLAFYSSMFKYYLGQRDACSIDNVILVLDDIEGIRIDDTFPVDDRRKIELVPIKMVLELITCMENRNGEVSAWSLNTIISCRHYVYRLMNSVTYSASGFYTQALEAYSSTSGFDLNKSPTIMSIVGKRFDALPRQDREREEKWDTAMNVVRELLEKIDSEVCAFVLELRLKNIRETLSCLKEIVFNKTWIQREAPDNKSGAFVIGNIHQYKPTSASLIRAIGMKESVVYNSNNSIIPNLLYNGEDGNLDLYPLLTLKYALGISNYIESRWDDTPISVSLFYTKVKKMFNDETISENFKLSMEYLIKTRLLLRSADQEQLDNDRLDEFTLKQVESVYVPGIAASLWEKLSRNSVLFEMYIDDIWLDNSKRHHSPKYSRGFIDDKFEVCMDHVETLASTEGMLFSRAYNCCGSGKEYYEMFSNKSISGHLLTGLFNSLNIFYRDDIAGEQEKIEMWRKRLFQLRKKCNNLII